VSLPVAVVLEIVVIDLSNLMCFDFDDFSLFSLALCNNHGLETVYLTRFKVCIECLRVNIFCKNQRFVDLGGLQDFPAKSNSQGLVGVPDVGWD
jgi:hypothetical protein